MSESDALMDEVAHYIELSNSSTSWEFLKDYKFFTHCTIRYHLMSFQDKSLSPKKRFRTTL
jgi:hypothetical protein